MSGMYKKMWKMCASKMGIYPPVFMPHAIMHKGLKVTILMALREHPLTGHAIMGHIEDKYGYLLRPDIVYPTLQMLEDMGYVIQTAREGKKEYSLTDEGKQFLQERSKMVEWLDWWAQRPKMGSEEHCA
jgi:DNA-binding PadR family transcriptional regulator